MGADETSERTGDPAQRDAMPATVADAYRLMTPQGIDIEAFRQFFRVAGGSVSYCISAVLVAYGIVKLLGPVLAGTDSIGAALPCLVTLAVYELALLGVLVLIVSRKVVDDAISVALLLGLYMIATSMALGSVVERDPRWALLPALIGTLLGAAKFWAMRRFVKIPFGVLSLLGLSGLLAANYFGPILMAQSVKADPADEMSRRGLWFVVWVVMLGLVGLVWIEGLRSKPRSTSAAKKVPFLQSAVMVYILALLLLVAASVHQYATAYMFVVPRRLGEFLGPVALGTLLVLEILRCMDSRCGPLHLAVSCVPLATMGAAIYEKSVLASGTFTFDIIVWPPMYCALMGVGLTAVSLRHRWRPLVYVVLAYILGTLLTAGYSPEHPWELNTLTCGSAFVAGLLIYGFATRRPHVCLLAVAIAAFGLANSETFINRAAGWQLTPFGAVAGVIGAGCVGVTLWFPNDVRSAVRLFGLVCLASFIFDVLPNTLHWRYAIVLPTTAGITLLLWLRMRDWLGLTMLVLPLGVRAYMLARQIVYWRLVILGFLVLAIGTVISLTKSIRRERDATPE